MMPSWTAAIPVGGAGMTRAETDRVTAIACATRMAGITAGEGVGYDGASHHAEDVAEKLARWLAKDTDDHHAPVRRTALCLAASFATEGTTDPDALTSTADWMIKFIIGGS